MKRVLAATAVAMTLAGCSSISGLDARSEFACKAPDGILCESMSGIYANAQQKNLPGQRVNRGGEAAAPAADLSHAKVGSNVMSRPIYSGTPIRSAPRVLRVWMSPWEDSDGDLHDQSYIYLPVDSGRWLIEHNRARIQDTYRPVRAPSSFGKGAAAAGADVPTPNAGPARAGMPSQTTDDGMVENGTLQQRPTPQQAASYLSGMLRPGGDGLPTD